jgi:hypothetical protein
MTGFSDSDGQIEIYLTNSSGGGFADYITIASGTTLGDLFDMKVGGNPKSFTIRVNGEKDLPSTRVLRSGERVSFTPEKIMVAI